MGKRGPKPKKLVNITWSPNFAYGIGLLATDGCLSSDQRHITFVSVDREQILNYQKAFGINVLVGKSFGRNKKKSVYRVQFSDVNFFKFLLSIGLMPAKSKKLGAINIPSKYFFDFLRGCFDGDGTFYSYWDKRWKSSYMFYTEFASASPEFVSWLQTGIFRRLKIKGHVTKDGNGSTLQLKYAKKESLKILKKIYETKGQLFLKRKKLKIDKALAIVGEQI